MIPTRFKAFRVYEQDGSLKGRLENTSIDELSAGSVVIKSHFSSINYKDALGSTGKGKILKSLPLIPGVDVSGEIVASQDPRYAVGAQVIVTGCGLGELADGGYSEYVRVPADWVVPLPKGLTLEEAMILGTAGFTAALCLERMQANGQTPEQGPILITGASGGVGTAAIQLLAQAGYQVQAVSGKLASHEFLKKLGAHSVVAPEHLQLGQRPLESTKWAGAIDNVGGQLLSEIISHIDLWGNVACVGMAGGFHLNTTVFPLILRGVSLIGVSSTNCPMPLRLRLWDQLAGPWKPQNLFDIRSKTLSLDQLEQGFSAILERQNVGRIIIKF